MEKCPNTHNGISNMENFTIDRWTLHGYIASEVLFQNPFYLPYHPSCLKFRIILSHTIGLTINFMCSGSETAVKGQMRVCLGFYLSPGEGGKIGMQRFSPYLKKCPHTWNSIQELITDNFNYLFLYGCDTDDQDEHFIGLWILKPWGKNVSTELLDRMIDKYYKHLKDEIIYVPSSGQCQCPNACLRSDYDNSNPCPAVDTFQTKGGGRSWIINIIIVLVVSIGSILLLIWIKRTYIKSKIGVVKENAHPFPYID